MKKCTGLFILFCVVSFQIIAQKTNFTIRGKIKGLDTKYLYLTIYNQETPTGSRRDSIPVKDNSFSYEGYVSGFSYAIISPNIERTIKKTATGYYPVKSSLFQFFAAPGYHLNFSGEIKDFVDAYPFGEKNNNVFAGLNRVIYPLQNKSVNLSVKIANKIVSDPDLIKRMKDTIALLDKEVIVHKENFIKNNPATAAAAWQLSDMMIRSQISNTTATEVFNKMNNEKLAGIIYYKEVAKRVEGFSATAIGKTVPEINTANTFTGKKFELSSLRGKYVVIDFWGTWCGPCIAGMPKLKEYLEKYKNKMEIVGVASEPDKGVRWKKFIADKPDYQWHHVLSSKEEDFILQFSVAGFPTKIIIDPHGKILGRFVGEDDAIYKTLDELLK